MTVKDLKKCLEDMDDNLKVEVHEGLKTRPAIGCSVIPGRPGNEDRPNEPDTCGIGIPRERIVPRK